MVLSWLSSPAPGQKKSPGMGLLLWAMSSLSGQYVHPLPFLIQAIVTDNTIDLGKQGEVPSHTDVLARMNPGSQLTNNDVAGANRFPAEYLYPTALSLAVATIP
jgi:hypothetical protein